MFFNLFPFGGSGKKKDKELIEELNLQHLFKLLLLSGEPVL